MARISIYKLSPVLKIFALSLVLLSIVLIACLHSNHLGSNSRAVPWDTTLKRSISDSVPEHEQCIGPKLKIGFAKTHKTASSTIQNVFLRHGLAHGVEFLLGAKNNYLGRLPRHFSVEALDNVDTLPWHAKLSATAGYDISTLHSRWNHTAIKYLLGPNAVFVTVLRDPITQFESMYTYMKIFKGEVPISSWINSTLLKATKEEQIKKVMSSRIGGTNWGMNQQLWDLGIENKVVIGDFETLEATIEKLDKDFDLVMISERMDESMVLLADALCLPLRNVSTLKNNVRKANKIVALTHHDKEVLARFQRPDQELYNHFNKQLDVKIREYGKERMAKDVAELQRLNQELHDECVIEETDRTQLKGDLKPYSNDVVGYRIRENITACYFAAFAELPFVNKVRSVQKSRWKQGR